MIAADRPVQRPAQAKLLVIDARGEVRHAPRARLVEFLRPGDLVVANDAATLPASLQGEHVPTGGAVEVRLAGRRSLAAEDVRRFWAVVFGAGGPLEMLYRDDESIGIDRLERTAAFYEQLIRAHCL